MIRIALDAMGGDYAPEPMIAGAIEAAPLVNAEILLVGNPDRMKLPPLPSNVRVVEAREVIEMDDKPADAVRKKKDASLVVCARMVKEGTADALVSAGNTGAATAVSLLTWGRIKGVDRPAIATFMPCKSGQFLFMDCGASPDVDPETMIQFALMGRAWVEQIKGIKNADVKLLNIGEEPGKGNKFSQEAYELLSPFPWFKGNIEGKDMFKNPPPVVVCEGFVGNVVLKASEGVGEFFFDQIRSAVPTGPMKFLFLPLRKVMAPVRQKADYAEYGGSPLLGVNGICIIGHGRSNAKAIRNAILNAVKAVEGRLVESIQTSVQGVRNTQ